MLEPGAIARSLQAILQDQDNVVVRLADVVGVDWAARAVLTAEGDPIPFDTLVLAAGAVTSDYGIEGVEEHAFPLESPDEALQLRSHVLACFEQADAHPELVEAGILTFVVVGGGPTGVELAGALIELIDRVLRKDFPRVDVERARVVLWRPPATSSAPSAPSPSATPTRPCGPGASRCDSTRRWWRPAPPPSTSVTTSSPPAPSCGPRAYGPTPWPTPSGWCRPVAGGSWSTTT